MLAWRKVYGGGMVCWGYNPCVFKDSEGQSYIWRRKKGREEKREDKERKIEDDDEGKNNGESWRVCNDGEPLACDGMMAVLLIPYQP